MIEEAGLLPRKDLLDMLEVITGQPQVAREEETDHLLGDRLVAELKRDLRAMPKVLPSANTSRRAKVGQDNGASGAKFAKP